MSKLLTIDVTVDEEITYQVTEEKFHLINNKFNLGLDINNFSKEDAITLYSYLDDSYITDSTVYNCCIYEPVIEEV